MYKIKFYRIDKEGVQDEKPFMILHTESRKVARNVALLAEENGDSISVEVTKPAKERDVKFKGVGDEQDENPED